MRKNADLVIFIVIKLAVIFALINLLRRLSKLPERLCDLPGEFEDEENERSQKNGECNNSNFPLGPTLEKR